MAFAAPLLPVLGSFFGSAGGIASAAGAGLSAFSSITAGNYAAQVAKNNAMIAEENAARESVAAQQEAVRSDREYAALLADQLAAQSGSGTSVNSRSNRQVRALTRRVGREAARDIARAGGDAAQRLKQDAANFRAEGKQARRQGIIDAVGAFVNLGTTATGSIQSNSKPTASLVTNSRNYRRWNHGGIY